MTTTREINSRVGSTPGAVPPAPRGWNRRLSVNITPVERVGRITIGLLAMIAGALLVSGAGSELVVMLAVLLILAGADLVVTGALGHCPLCAKLGHVAASLQRSS